MAEKGGSRTLPEPYGSQTGFEDQRHHRAPSFSTCVFSYLEAFACCPEGSCLPFAFTISNPNAFAMWCRCKSTYRLCIWTEVYPEACIAASTLIRLSIQSVIAVLR